MRRKILIGLLALFSPTIAHAQSTATPVTPGLLTTSGCPGSETICFVPYSVSNPLNTTGTFTGTVVSGPTNSAGAYSGVTVGTSSGSILAASTAKVYADFANQSPTATICLSTTNPATITGTACAAGEITLPPLWEKSFEGTYVPSDQWFAIASAASTPLTVGAK